MKGKRRQRSSSVKVDLSKRFPDEWIKDIKWGIASIEEGELDKPHGTYSNAMKMLFAYKVLADIAIAYTPPKLRPKIGADAEIVCNRIGASIFRDGDSVTKCLTKEHGECTGAYYSLAAKRRIICKCSCHSKRDASAEDGRTG